MWRFLEHFNINTLSAATLNIAQRSFDSLLFTSRCGIFDLLPCAGINLVSEEKVPGQNIFYFLTSPTGMSVAQT